MDREELKATVPAGVWAKIAPQLGERSRPPARRNKYGNEPVYIDGIRFPSTREGNRYIALKLLMQVGEVRRFTRQGRWVLDGGVEYVEDFCVEWADGRMTHEDAKGIRTKEYRLKKRQVEARYGVEIVEV